MVVPFEKAEPCEVRGGGVKRSEAKRGYGYSRWRASSDFWGMDCMREKKREREREREREGGNGRLKARRRCYRCVPIYLCCLKKPSVFLGPSILILGNRAEEDRN